MKTMTDSVNLVCFLIWLLFACSAQAQQPACAGEGPNVVLVTFDGVRRIEFFNPRLMRRFWSFHAAEGEVRGGRGPIRNRYKIASRVSVSLPSYHAMFLGKPDGCRDNKCGRVQEETVFERIRRELHLERREIAVIASWSKIAFAVEHVPGSLTVNAGPEPFEHGQSDAVTARLNQLQHGDPPAWEDARKDRYTLEHALAYLRKHCPRVLYLSLGDADEWAHLGEKRRYREAVAFYDDALDRLIRTLDGMGAYGANTLLMVTTDHNRGSGPLWRTHGITSFTERGVFLYARGPSVPKVGKSGRKGSHLTLREEIEMGMGLSGRL